MSTARPVLHSVDVESRNLLPTESLSEDRPLVLICSVALEAEPVLRRIEGSSALVIGGKPAVRGRLREREVLALTGGMGKTNAAHALTAALESIRAAGVIGFGVGGAYPGRGVAVGEIALATAEIYGDEGVDAPGGWISTEGIGIPLLESASGRLFNTFPVSAAATAAAAAVLTESGVGHALGHFVTVSACSGTTAGGAALAARHDAICETMEGAAYAHVAALYGLPYVGIRGISNLVEDRDLSGWRLQEAAEAAGGAVAAAIPHISFE